MMLQYIHIPMPASPHAIQRRTRLAPSPTGDLHLGNARTLLLNWALARREGWTVLLRHEDLDARRATPELCRRIEDSLQWLGLDWDEGPLVQSSDLAAYLEAMRTLGSSGRIFRTDMSRREIRDAIGAPHAGGELVFPRSLRPGPATWGFQGVEHGHRFAMEPGLVTVTDELQGVTSHDPATEAGDPIVWTRDGRPSYQLAVVVDDERQGVTDVFRADDLLPSAARQHRLAEALGSTRPRRWWHVPLVHDQEGRRLAKRDGDEGLAALEASGVSAERVLGLLLHRSGLLDSAEPVSARDAVGLIDRDALRTLVLRERTAPCRILPEDLLWLRA